MVPDNHCGDWSAFMGDPFLHLEDIQERRLQERAMSHTAAQKR
jgi:hypothetical protein